MSTESPLTLYDYWRSSACYRVRIALNLKGLPYAQKPVHLLKNGGEQHSTAHRELNPQETIPVLADGVRVIRQSLAIIEYLDETYGGHMLLPATARDRAHVRGLALLIACDIHPLNNLRVMQFLERDYGVQQAERERWTRHWMEEGFRAFEAILAADSATGLYCHGDAPTLADACLIPQVYNANRFGVDLAPYPTIRRINAQCLSLPAFDAARPERQPDAA
ncbi:maleylacetoacetate isomerase [Dokdonella soli]|uniref:Maleylacetoacetate isomerase n=1 Tax=Dokdonella soli TaxID=529810 RepID=A0ABN1ILT0_9GAMM